MSFKIAFKDWPQTNGRIEYGQVPWDSEIFGFPFYELRVLEYFEELSQSLGELLNHLYDSDQGRNLAFIKISPKEIRIIRNLTTNGFYPVETMVEVHGSLNTLKTNRTFERLNLRPATSGDKSKILEIARQAFVLDRYHLDPNLDDDRAGYRYEYWLDNGLKNQEDVLVYEDTSKNQTLGFCHLKDVDSNTIDFSLGAMDPSYQKTGLGLLMYQECLELGRKHGKKKMITHISINNLDVVNIFSSMGFSFRNPTLVLHRYFDHSK